MRRVSSTRTHAALHLVAERPQRFAFRRIASFPSSNLRAPNVEYKAQIWGVNPMPAAAGVLFADFQNGTVACAPVRAAHWRTRRAAPPHCRLRLLSVHGAGGERRRGVRRRVARRVPTGGASHQQRARLQSACSALARRRTRRLACRLRRRVFPRVAHTELQYGTCVSRDAHCSAASRTHAASLPSSATSRALCREADTSTSIRQFWKLPLSRAEAIAVWSPASVTIASAVRHLTAAAAPALSLSELWRTQCSTPGRVLVSGACILVIDSLEGTEEPKLWLWCAEANRLELQQELRLPPNELVVRCWCTHGDDSRLQRVGERTRPLPV